MFILPVNRDDYEGQIPYVLIGLAVINGLILAATYLFSSPEYVFRQYGFIPAEPHFRTALMSMFLHAGLLHYLGNFFFLWMFGYRIENAFGRIIFVAVYLSCGMGAILAHYVFNAEATIPCVGASGAISGIAGCYLVLFPKSHFDVEIYFGRFLLHSIPTSTVGAVGAWIAEQTALGLIALFVSFSSTAFLAHVGGFGMGMMLAAFLVKVSPEIRQRGESIRRSKLNHPRRSLITPELRVSRLTAGKLAGVVVDALNLPAKGVHVIEVSSDWKTPVRVAETDDHGRWSMDLRPQESTYRLLFEKEPGIAQLHVRLKINARFDHDLRVNLPNAAKLAATAASGE